MADGSDTEDADSAAAVLVGNTDSAAPTLVTLISHVSMLSMLWLCIIYLNAMHLHDIYLHIILVPHSHESVDMIPLTFFLCRSHTVRHGFYKFCTSLELFFSRRCLARHVAFALGQCYGWKWIWKFHRRFELVPLPELPVLVR